MKNFKKLILISLLCFGIYGCDSNAAGSTSSSTGVAFKEDIVVKGLPNYTIHKFFKDAKYEDLKNEDLRYVLDMEVGYITETIDPAGIEYYKKAQNIAAKNVPLLVEFSTKNNAEIRRMALNNNPDLHNALLAVCENAQVEINRYVEIGYEEYNEKMKNTVNSYTRSKVFGELTKCESEAIAMLSQRYDNIGIYNRLMKSIVPADFVGIIEFKALKVQVIEFDNARIDYNRNSTIPYEACKNSEKECMDRVSYTINNKKMFRERQYSGAEQYAIGTKVFKVTYCKTKDIETGECASNETYDIYFATDKYALNYLLDNRTDRLFDPKKL